jgi:serine/threonine protein kinase/WD40 repeat protein
VALTPGTRIGTFEITGHIGTGGMGEVYRARDTTLGREVAIKVLPDALSRDRSRLIRFEREAQLLASLNHPNIATIYGVERDAADESVVRALVMELVPGDTLADRLLTLPRDHGLPLADTLHIARQIVSALDAAHERGIVHRDLKPSNIKLRPDGTLKVLDFGLAKIEPAVVAAATAETETIAVDATRDGAILGSPGYMSPEQARGETVDARTDIWAFGCVLFEITSGRPPFAGASAIEIIAATLTREADWDALPADTPESLHRLMRRCLQRDVRRRLRSIADASFELDEAVVRAASSTTATTTSKAVAFQRLTDRLGLNESPAISPDGRMVAFVAPADGVRQIWVRLLSGGAPLQLTHGAGHHEQPRWTPDGSAIVYFAVPDAPGESGSLMEVSALGGSPRPLASSLSGGDVSHDGRRIATFQVADGTPHLVTVSRLNGSVEHVCAGPRGVVCRSPRWSPDDRWIAFHSTAIPQFDERLHVVRPAGGEPTVIARATAFKGLSWLPDSSGVVYSSSDGSTVHYPPTHNLRRVGRDGRHDRAITVGDLSYVEPDVDASGRIVAARIRSQSDIWKFPISGSPAENTRAGVRITRQSGQVQTPSVSPDGTEVAYLSDNGGHANLWVARTDGSGAARQITFEQDAGVSIGLPLWSPVDDRIAFVKGRAGLGIWIVHADGRGVRQLRAGGATPCWSPDGAWVYHTVFADKLHVEKIPSGGGPCVVVRRDANSHAASVGATALYYAFRASSNLELEGWEIRRASPEDGPSEPIARIAGSRLPVSPLFVSTTLSRDGRWLALPLIDGHKSSIGILPVTGGSFTPVIDLGDRPTIIARQVSWSPDGSIYAAVAEINEDIVLLDGLI